MMVIGKMINEETGVTEGGYLTFDSGKKVMLTLEEYKEFESRIRFLKLTWEKEKNENN